MAEGEPIEHLVSAAGNDDGAGNLSGGDRFLDQRLDQGESRRVEGERRGVGACASAAAGIDKRPTRMTRARRMRVHRNPQSRNS